MNRRPIFCRALWIDIAKHVCAAAEADATGKVFGLGYVVPRSLTHQVQYHRDPLFFTSVATAAAASRDVPGEGIISLPIIRTNLNVGPCIFQCTTSTQWHKVPRTWHVLRNSCIHADRQWGNLKIASPLCDAHFTAGGCALRRFRASQASQDHEDSCSATVIVQDPSTPCCARDAYSENAPSSGAASSGLSRVT